MCGVDQDRVGPLMGEGGVGPPALDLGSSTLTTGS